MSLTEPEVAISAPPPGPPAPSDPSESVLEPAVDAVRRTLFSRPWRRVAGAASAVTAATALAACDLTQDTGGRPLHLLRRLTYGATPADRAHLESVGETAWLTEQLAPHPLDTSALDAKLVQLPALEMTPVELDQAYPGNGYQLASAELKLAFVIRAVHSPAQLFERMVEFWSDHFNVPTTTRETSLLKVVEDREVIRPHALGRFKDLLVASAQSPAMLHFLDNAFSFAGRTNENYSRELLELHTVGRAGGYDEGDVVATAKLLTGWSINPTTFEFQFRGGQHDTSHVEILGWSRPGGADHLGHGVEFLHHLASLPQTAEFVCTKLARRFVGDQPPPDLVSAMTAAWANNDTGIVPVLEAMITHPSFESGAGAKFNRPLDYLTAVLRAVRADITPSTNLNQLAVLGRQLSALGQLPFGWAAPNGFPDVEGAWLNAGGLLTRWNLVGDLVASFSPLITIDLATVASPLVGLGAHDVYDGFARALLGEPTTGAGRLVLDQATGWDESTTPTGAVFLQGIAPVVVTLLASADAQYR